MGWVILVILAGTVVWAAAHRPSTEAAFSPKGTGPQGAKALALLVGRLGGQLDTSGALPPADRGVVLVLVDRVAAADRPALLSWIRDGGTLVIADPGSELAGVAPAEGASPHSGVVAEAPLPPGCSAPWVAGVSRIDTVGLPLLAAPPEAARSCFALGRRSFFAVERTVGRGRVVALAGADLWTNASLGAEANSVLASDLLVPREGTIVSWLSGPSSGSVSRVGGGRQSLLQLLPARVDEMLVGGLTAFVVACLWRGRRLGGPVSEDDPVVVPGSELVGAVSRLMARNDQWGHAAELLRGDLRHDVFTSLAVTAAMAPEVVVALVADRTGRDRASVMAAMYGSAPADEGQLIDLARAVEEIRQELHGVHT